MKNDRRTTKSIGDLGERRAARYLRLRGFRIRERNYRAGKYEIDLIAASWRTILFVEVKTRSYRAVDLESAAPPSLAVDADKMRFTRAAAMRYLRENPTKKRPRMDVIEVWLVEGKVKKIHWIPAAY